MTRAALIFAALALLAVLPSLAWAPLTINLPLLRDAICYREQESPPKNALDDFGKDGELGGCQIKPRSAWYWGGLRGVDAVRIVTTLLTHPGPVALEIVTSCSKIRRNWTPYLIAACYNRGPNARRPLTRNERDYARQATIDYANAIFARRLKAAGLPTQSTQD